MQPSMKATSSEGSGASRTTSRRNASAWPGGCTSFRLCRTVQVVSRTPSETSFTFAKRLRCPFDPPPAGLPHNECAGQPSVPASMRCGSFWPMNWEAESERRIGATNLGPATATLRLDRNDRSARPFGTDLPSSPRLFHVSPREEVDVHRPRLSPPPHCLSIKLVTTQTLERILPGTLSQSRLRSERRQLHDLNVQWGRGDGRTILW